MNFGIMSPCSIKPFMAPKWPLNVLQKKRKISNWRFNKSSNAYWGTGRRTEQDKSTRRC